MQDPSPKKESTISKNLDDRLRIAVKRAGGPKAVALQTEFGESTIYNYMKLKPSPPIDFVYALAEVARVRPEWLFIGQMPIAVEDESGDWETSIGPPQVGEKRVPVREVSASAGHGKEVFEEDPRYWFTFPLEWLMSLGDPDAMEIIKVEGDSQAPHLNDGDHVMIDLAQRQPKDGLFVVEFDERLFIKRLNMKGRSKAELLSANPAYPPREVDIPDEDDDVAQSGARIIGRVVWSGGMRR